MRNFKKILALVLVLVMSMSFAGAAYADADSINYTEAVEVMSYAGIFNGIDGEFQPQGDLTREQAMKIVAYMLLGQRSADALPKDIQPFADVEAGRWSAGAIAYCANKGIVSGDGTGNFNPTANVTGYEFGKMVMGAAGITGEFTGSSWKFNVALALDKYGLLNGLETLVLSDNLTREQACQMAFNAAQYGTTTYTGRYVIKAVSDAAKAAKVNGEVYASRSAAKEEMTVLNLTLGTDYEIVDETVVSNSLLSKVHKVYNTDHVDTYGFESNIWYSVVAGEMDIAYYTAYPTHSSYEDGYVTAAALYTSLGLTKYDYAVDGAITADVWTDGAYSTLDIHFNDKDTKIGGNGVATTIYWDAYWQTLKIVEVTTYVGEVVSVFEGKAETATTLAQPATADIKFTFSDDTVNTVTVKTTAYEEGDMVLLNAAYVDTTSGTVMTIQAHELADAVVGTVDKYVAGKSVTVDGVTYKPADELVGNLYPTTGDIFDDYYVYYIDAYNNVYKCVPYSGAKVQADGYYYVLGYQVSYTGAAGDLFTAVADGTAAAKAHVVNLDGSVEVIDLPVVYDKVNKVLTGFFFTAPDGTYTEITKAMADAGYAEAGYWASYKLVDGEVNFLEKAGQSFTTDGDINVGSYTLTSKTVYTYINTYDETVKATLGYKKISFSNADTLVIADKNGVVSNLYVVKTTTDRGTSVADLAYAVEATGHIYNGGAAWTFVVDGTVETKVVATGVSIEADKVYKLTINNLNGMVTAATPVADASTVIPVTVTLIDEDYFKGAYVVTDEEGNPVLDEEGNALVVTLTKTLDEDYVVVDFETGAASELALKSEVIYLDLDADGDIDLIYVLPVAAE